MFISGTVVGASLEAASSVPCNDPARVYSHNVFQIMIMRHRNKR